MKKPFKYNLEKTVQKLIKIALVTGCILAFSDDETNMSTELPPEYKVEIMEIPMPKEIKFMTPREIKPYLDMALKEVDLPLYIDRNYVEAKISVESNWNPDAVSNAGAKGLMQIMPETWSDYDSTNYRENVFKPGTNILVGIKYLKKIDEDLRKNYSGYSSLSDREKQDITSATYNAGITKMRKANWEINKMPLETRNHVEKIRRMLGE